MPDHTLTLILLLVAQFDPVCGPDMFWFSMSTLTGLIPAW